MTNVDSLSTAPAGQQVNDSLIALPTPPAVVAPQGGRAERGITRERVGSRQLCLSRLVIPPLTTEQAHLHADHETAIYIVSGEIEVRHGPDLTEVTIAGPGDFVYIPPNVPHQPINRSRTQEVVVLAARTDPHDIESLVLLPTATH
ncbi:cupin domain-containing protein [Kitasatospora sp. GP82]|uniref:cupin domain-containing protein n=1 Tax=Kitasatospora sp. GP82 TaxID=3035089 RepID=UPI00247367DD|nr:cupin domain-containing protein [Kitasatospora sp. GP82]MDH6128255.1 putative RmlC-like cupin family protein [Kitasatospora sp. GP82]